MRTEDATYIKCDLCHAPYRKPLPDNWSVVTYKVGTGAYAQIHKDTCPARPRNIR